MFGQPGEAYLANIDRLLGTVGERKYTFLDNAEYEAMIQSDTVQAMQVYWTEIIARSHLTAITSILRNRHWARAVLSGAKDGNLLAFAAGLRGLIESAADSMTALHPVATTLARMHSTINAALASKSGSMVCTSTELEELLIHFTHARKLRKGEIAPASHSAKRVCDYIAILEKARVEQIVDCYSSLCDLTHPGMSSVWMWLKPVAELEFHLEPGQDHHLISSFAQEYHSMYPDLLACAFNGGILTLAVLNYFPTEQFHTPYLLRWDLSNIPVWLSIQRDLIGVPISVK